MFIKMYTVFTTNGEGEHARHTSREVAAMPRTEEAPTSTEHGKPQAHGSGKASDGREWGDVKTGRVGTAGRKSACTACRMRHPPTKTGAEPTNRAHGYDTKIGP